MTKPLFKQYLSTNPALHKVIEGRKANLKKLSTPTKTKAIDSHTLANPPPKEIHTQYQHQQQKLTGTSNHWSLITLNTSVLNSSIKGHRLTDQI